MAAIVLNNGTKLKLKNKIPSVPSFALGTVFVIGSFQRETSSYWITHANGYTMSMLAINLSTYFDVIPEHAEVPHVENWKPDKIDTITGEIKPKIEIGQIYQNKQFPNSTVTIKNIGDDIVWYYYNNYPKNRMIIEWSYLSMKDFHAIYEVKSIQSIEVNQIWENKNNKAQVRIIKVYPTYVEVDWIGQKETHTMENLLEKYRLLPSLIKIESSGAQRRVAEHSYHSIPPEWIIALADICLEGKISYGDYQWLKGLPISTYYDHLMDHLMRALAGDTTEDNWGKVAWGALAIRTTLRMHPELQDMPWGEPLND